MSIKSVPTQGYSYQVKSGDTLSRISQLAYGRASLYPTIWEANLTSAKSDDPDLIYPDEVFYIPRLKPLAPKVSDKSKEQFTLLIGNREIPVVSSRLVRTIDTAADGWSAVFPFFPNEDPELDDLTKPYTYADSFVFLGDKKVISGPLYGVQPQLSEQGRVKNLSGASYTTDSIDSTMRPPYEKFNIRLEDLAKELVKPFGIKAIFLDSSEGKFDETSADPTQSVFSHLSKLAGQKGLLISCDVDGNMVFSKANTKGKPVASIVESPETFGGSGSTQYQANFDGRKRFSDYKAIGQSPGAFSGEAHAKDKNVGRPRFLTFKADDIIEGELQKAADWRRSKQLADALTIPFPVSSWYYDGDNLWEPGQLVTVKSETIFCPDGFTFLIREVEYINEVSGKYAVLKLVPPTVYSGEELVVPWEP